MTVFGMASINEVEAIFVAALLAGLLAVWGVITQRVVARRNATLEYFSRMDNDRDLIQARKVFVRVTGDGDDCDLISFAGPDKYDTEEAAALRLTLNENERLAIGIQFGIIDREFVRRAIRGTLIRDWELSAPWVYKLRSETRNPAIYHEFEDLARSMSDVKMPRRSYTWRLWF
jgi:hypothetical protein